MKLGKTIAFSIASVALIGAMVAGDVVYNTFKESIFATLVPPKVDETAASATKAEGKELAEKIEGEGIVMLKNNGVLPLKKEEVKKVNILGFGAIQWIYGGSGSGRVLSTQGDNAWDEMVDIVDAFRDRGVQVNEDILSYYSQYASVNHDVGSLNFNMDNAPFTIGLKDPDVDESSYHTLLEESKSFSDTAVVVLSRQIGESEDMPTVQYKSKPSQSIDNNRHQLQVSEEEEKLLEYAGENFDRVIVVVNSTNAFQMDFLTYIKGIDALLTVGPTGEYGAKAIADVIFGDVNPSGKLADTLPYDFTKNLNFEYSGYQGVSFYSDNNLPYGINQTTNAGVTRRPSLPYIDYVEGIYVGYRYYETADKEGTFENEVLASLDEKDQNIQLKGYDAVVQYPFGYGLSYTSFSWEVIALNLPSNSHLKADSEIELTVQVTNEGTVPGKDVVEIYMTPEYKVGGIEKAEKNLVAFDKTEIIEPGKNQTLTFSIPMRSFASYDCYDKNGNGRTTYEIDPGTYQLSISSDAHNVATVDFLTGVKNAPGVLSYVFDDEVILDKDPVTGETIDNLFTGNKAVDGVSIDGIGDYGDDAEIPYVSRKDLKNIHNPISNPDSQGRGRAMGELTKDYILFSGANRQDKTKINAWDNATEDEFGNPTTEDDSFFGLSGDMKVYNGNEVSDLGLELGADYDDERWESLLDQVTYNEANNMINNAHPRIAAINSIGMPSLYNLDGPSQCSSFAAKETRGVGFPADCVLAQTWNKTLAYEMGLSLGQDMNAHGLSGNYGTAVNIHRSHFAGRNYEYYSEDPVLTGKMAAQVTTGVTQSGRLAFVKHFAAAETETSRDSLYTWMSEQALREIYIEAFRIIIEEGKCNALMTSYNRIGALWAGGSSALMLGVLRGEWGFNGTVITDYSDNNQYMNMDEAIRHGGDLGMAVSLVNTVSSSSSKRFKKAVRDAVHHTVWAWLNSQYELDQFNRNPYEGKTISSATTKYSWNWVEPAVLSLNIAIIASVVGMVYFGILDGIGLDFVIGKKKEQ